MQRLQEAQDKIRYETEIGTLQWHPALAPRPLPQSWPSPYTGTLQWHPAMAPCRNGTTSTPSKLVVTRLAHHNGTLQWHHPLPSTSILQCNGTTSHHPHHSTLEWHPAMAPRPLPQSWSSPSLPLAHYNGTLQAPSNGTTSTPPKLVVTLPLNHSTLQWHPTMAPSNGTTSTAPCNGTLVPRPIRQSGSSPSPLLEVRTPIAIAIWGKTTNQITRLSPHRSRLSPSHRDQICNDCRWGESEVPPTKISSIPRISKKLAAN